MEDISHVLSHGKSRCGDAPEAKKRLHRKSALNTLKMQKRIEHAEGIGEQTCSPVNGNCRNFSMYSIGISLIVSQMIPHGWQSIWLLIATPTP